MSPVFWVWQTASEVVAALPPSLSERLARTIGIGAYYLWFTRRHVARENFAHVLDTPASDPQVGRVARASFSNYTVYILNMMRYPEMSFNDFRRRVHFHVDAATNAILNQDRPVIIVSAHYGNMDYAAPVAADRYRRLTLAAETIKPLALFEYLGRLRSQNGVDLIPYDRAPRKIIEALRRNGIVGFMIDLGINSHKDINTVPVRFFGAMTPFPSSAAILAQRYDAPICVVSARIDAEQDIHIEIAPPLYVPRQLPRAQAEFETMQRVAERFEKFIRAQPDQWYVFRPMWPKLPHPVLP